MTNVIAFPNHEQRSSDRLSAIHHEAVELSRFTASLGTPDEWLGSAIDHVKCQIPPGDVGGMVTVSAAALSLMVMKLEELLYDGPKVALPIRD